MRNLEDRSAPVSNEDGGWVVQKAAGSTRRRFLSAAAAGVALTGAAGIAPGRRVPSPPRSRLRP